MYLPNGEQVVSVEQTQSILMFDSWYEVENDRVILRVLFVEYDYGRIKNTTQGYLVELRHTI